MSYTLAPFAVDLEQLRAAVGSKDEALLNAIIAADPDEFEEDEDEDDEDEIPLARALRHLIMGQRPVKDSAHQYGYALMKLCAHLGERQTSDQWESIRFEYLEATGMDQLLNETGPPVRLPENDDFPMIGHLPADRVAALAASLGETAPATAAPSGQKPRKTLGAMALGAVRSRIAGRGSLTESDWLPGLEEYGGWLRAAAAQNKGLVFFYH